MKLDLKSVQQRLGKFDLKKIDLKKLDVKTVRLGLAGLLVVVAVVLGAIALLGGDSGDGSSEGVESEAVALSAPELLAQASSLGHPAFWVGPRAGTESYELTSTPEDRIYIRYLTGGAQAGDPRSDFLAVGTYPVPNARQALEKGSKGSGGEEKLSQHQGYEVLSGSGENAYVVFDNQPDMQIEIFSPQPGEAAELAVSGLLRPLG